MVMQVCWQKRRHGPWWTWMHLGRVCGGVRRTLRHLSPACFPVRPPGLDDPRAAAWVIKSICPDSWPHGAVWMAVRWILTALLQL